MTFKSDTAADLRGLMAGFPTGVAIVAAFDADGHAIGMTCSSLCSVALDPPVLLVCLREGGPTAEAVLSSGAFSVNLLDADARAAAELFASGAADRFARVRWRGGGAGPHLVADAHSVADCRVWRTQRVGDHVVVLGEVDGVTNYREPRPLLYGLRRFARWEGDGQCDGGFASAVSTLECRSTKTNNADKSEQK
ncbi:hypothetical protein GCM10027447_29730 [Glycomyces halotolerans]